MTLIQKTLRKFGAAAYLGTIASELEQESKEMEDVFSGGGDQARVWAEEIRAAIARASKRLSE